MTFPTSKMADRVQVKIGLFCFIKIVIFGAMQAPLAESNPLRAGPRSRFYVPFMR